MNAFPSIDVLFSSYRLLDEVVEGFNLGRLVGVATLENDDGLERQDGPREVHGGLPLEGDRQRRGGEGGVL